MARNQASNLWTTSKLVHMSQSLAKAYGANLDQDNRHRTNARWTAQQLLTLSAAKSFPMN